MKVADRLRNVAHLRQVQYQSLALTEPVTMKNALKLDKNSCSTLVVDAAQGSSARIASWTITELFGDARTCMHVAITTANRQREAEDGHINYALGPGILNRPPTEWRGCIT